MTHAGRSAGWSRWALGLATLAALLSAPPTAAVDVASMPIKASVLAKPNVVFGMDDSGSMDLEALVDGTRDGMVWGNVFNATMYPGGRPRTGWNSGDTGYYYLFPNGVASGVRRYGDFSNRHGLALPPTAELAWARSADYNQLYYDSNKTYAPWSPAYLASTGTVTFGNADPSAARSHPVLGTGTLPLDRTVHEDQPEWRFSFAVGMTIPAGATNVLCAQGWVGALPFQVTTSNFVCTAAVPYYPATFWKRQACTPNGSSCVTNWDGNTLQRYEIKSGQSFPSGRSHQAELQNYANWFTYHRKRKLMLAAAMGQVLEDMTNMRLGVVPFNERVPPTMMDADAASAAANRLAVTGRFYTADGQFGTPTHAAMAYIHNQFDTNPGIVQYACQRNAMFVITDGFANDAGGSPPPYNQNRFGAGPPYQSILPASMADKALGYFTHRLRATVSPLAAGKVPLGDQTVKNPNPNPDLHLLTYGLTLGAKGRLWPTATDPFVTPPVWPTNLPPSDPSQIDDLWHATLNGRGQMYLAAETATTAAAIRAALLDIAQQAGAQSAVAVSSVNLYRGDGLAYLASYNSAGWTGDLSTRPVDLATGVVGTTTSWSAAAQLNARNWTTRVIATSVNGAGTAFAAPAVGARLNAGNAWGNTGDLVDYLRGNRSQEGTTFRRRSGLIGAVINAEPVIDRDNGVAYLASGEGMLHAIDTRTKPGDELWAFVPEPVLPRMGASSSRQYQFKPLLDGSPVVGRSSTTTQLLVAGMGAAGRGYYALDVTSPRGLTEAQLASKVKWTFPQTNDSATQAKVGQTLGKPAFARLPSGEHVVLLTSGYNSTGDGQGRLWMLHALTGAVLHEFVTPEGAPGNDAGLAHVSAFVAGDGSASHAYAGDLLGNVWRFDLVTRGAPFKVAQLRDAAGTAQPVTAAPELVAHSGQRIVLVGTGRLLGASDLGGNSPQSFYAIADGASLANARASLVRQVYDPAGNSFSNLPVDWATQRGWFLDLPAGQLVNTRPVAAHGMVAFTANQTGATDCSASSALYAMGLGGTDGSQSLLSTTSISSAATAVLTSDAGQSKVAVIGQTADGTAWRKPLASGQAIRSSKGAWREIRR